MSSLRIFRYFKTSPEIIRLAVMMYVRYPLSLRNVEDLLHERGIDITHETVRFWRNRFGTIFAAEIRRNRVRAMWAFPASTLASRRCLRENQRRETPPLARCRS
jgi:putative transposase